MDYDYDYDYDYVYDYNYGSMIRTSASPLCHPIRRWRSPVMTKVASEASKIQSVWNLDSPLIRLLPVVSRGA